MRTDISADLLQFFSQVAFRTSHISSFSATPNAVILNHRQVLSRQWQKRQIQFWGVSTARHDRLITFAETAISCPSQLVTSSYHSIRCSPTLLQSFVFSRFLLGLTQEQVHRLQKIQNNRAHIICLTSKHQHMTPVPKALHWLPVKTSIEYNMLWLCDRLELLPTMSWSSLNDTFHPHTLGQSITTCWQERNQILWSWNITYAAATLLNSLSGDIKHSPSLASSNLSWKPISSGVTTSNSHLFLLPSYAFLFSVVLWVGACGWILYSKHGNNKCPIIIKFTDDVCFLVRRVGCESNN